MSDVNAFLDMFEAINSMVTATNGAMVVDANASSKLGDAQSKIMQHAKDALADDLDQIKQHVGEDDITEYNTRYSLDNSKWNGIEQKISNMVESATTDVNNGSSQAQQDLAMAGTINQAIGFFNGLLSQAFAA